MKRIIFVMLILCSMATLYSPLSSEVMVKVRDIAYIDGLKENQVFGFGLVVGLQGTGDSKSVLIQSSLKNVLKNLGFVEDENLNSKNIAAVLLTAKLPAYVRIGDRVDVNISSIGDAKSLEGGILIQSPMRGDDGKVYVVAQGALSFDSPRNGGKSVKTTASVVEGGIVESEIVPDIITEKEIEKQGAVSNYIIERSMAIVLRKWDFTLANSIMKSIAEFYPVSKPSISESGKISIKIPENMPVVEFISGIENLEITPSFEARVVVNEGDGTIVMGKDVKISEVVVSKDGMIVRVEGDDVGKNVSSLKEASTVKDLVDSLNYVGATSHDIISILKALKEAGALHANLIIK